MKNSITHLVIAVIAFATLTFLLSYTRPASDEAKQYIVVFEPGKSENLEKSVNQKLSEGWRLQGGVCVYGQSHYQAMVK